MKRPIADELAALPYIGPVVGTALLPNWCADSIVDASRRSGRSAASLVIWALAWSIGMALAIALLSIFLILIGWPGVAAILWLVLPIAAGGIVGGRTPGLGGLGVGFVGLVVGGLLFGILVCALAVLGPLASASAPDPLLYIPLLTFALPLLTGAQFGSGLLIATVVSTVRGTSPP
jgi:hypothetical protein